jgi:hypothetical protein
MVEQRQTCLDEFAAALSIACLVQELQFCKQGRMIGSTMSVCKQTSAL